MPKQIVTLYISDTVVRTMVTEGSQIQQWAEMQFEPGLIENNAIVDEEAVAQKIKQLLDIQAIKTRKVFVGISGIRCLTRPILLPKLPKEILDEAVRREAERLLPVPLDELYLTWQTIPGPEDKTQVFLAAIPRGTVNPLMNVITQAGFKPVFMDLKPLLLARLAGEETAIMVDVQGMDFDIIVMVNGVPQPIRSIPFPGENLSWQDKLPIIRDELDRTITFYNTNNPETAVENDVPVYVSGQLGDEAEFCRMLSQEIQRNAVSIPSQIDVPEGFDSSMYMANISLALQDTTLAKNAGNSVVNLNNLPAAYKPQPVSSTNILKALGVAAAIIVLAAVIFMVQNTTSSIASKKESLESSKALLTQNQLKVQILNKNLTDLEGQIETQETLQQNFTDALGNLELQSVGLNRDIEVTMDEAPSSVRLTSVVHNEGILTIRGVAPGEKTVLSYILALESTGRFAGKIKADTEILEDGSTAFTLVGSVMIESEWVSSMEVILGNLPSTIQLTAVSTSIGALTLDGIAPDEEILLIYLNKLDSSGKFGEITISNITKLETGERGFSIVIRIGETGETGE